MAIYHLSVKPISRATGRSAVASAAYRTAERLTNERDGLTHDFTRRSGVEHAEIVLPGDTMAKDGNPVQGSGPAWAWDRSALWNAAEASEKRKDARVAREIEIALPHELTAAQRLELTRDFAQGLAQRYGVAVDFAIHAPHQDSNVLNHHAHIMLTTRKVLEIGPDAPHGLGEKSELELENRKLEALGLPTTHEQVRDIRMAWEERANEHLARAGLDIRIDHRSHRERGLEIEPTQHMGVHATQMQRRGKDVSRSRMDAETAKRNAERIRENPEQVLTLITGEKSVFDRRDMARALHRYIGDAEEFQNALAKVMASPALIELQAERRDERGQVVEAARHSTREMVGIERDMAASADRMALGRSFMVAGRHVEAAMARQDAAIRRADGAGLSAEQREAIAHVAGPEGIAAVVGLAGAGKSTMLAAAREAWEAQGFRVHGAALAGKAAEGLEESSGIASRTLASWERSWERGRDVLDRRDVFVIDEAGMIGSKQLARFIGEADRMGAKIVLVGDPEQLQPIGAGAAFRAVAERVGFVELEEIRRQREGWQRAASVDFGRHRTAEGLEAYARHGAIRFEATVEQALNAIVRDVTADMDARPDGTRLVLAHRRVDVQDLNDAIRGVRLARGELAGELVYQTAEGARAFAPGDRLMFRENSRELGVKNGMLGTVETAQEGHLVVRLDSAQGPGQGRAVSVSMADYAAVDHGYAATIHKSQGATVDRAYVLDSGTMDRHMTYVAMTRHRDGAQLYADRSEFSDVAALTARLSRSQAKETTLDYDQAGYAARRGLGRGVDRRGTESEIVMPPRPAQDRAAARQVMQAEAYRDTPVHSPEVLRPEVEAGRAGFRERYEAHKRQQAAEAARDEQARALVREWGRLTKDYNQALPGLEADPSLGGARARLLRFGDALQAHPDALRALRERGRAYGVEDNSTLARVVADRQPGRVIAGLMNGVEANVRRDLKLAAERAAALERERRLARSLSRGGPSMGR